MSRNVPAADNLQAQSVFLTHRWRRIAGKLKDIPRALASDSDRQWAERYLAYFREQSHDLRGEIVAHNRQCEQVNEYSAKIDASELPGW